MFRKLNCFSCLAILGCTLIINNELVADGLPINSSISAGCSLSQYNIQLSLSANDFLLPPSDLYFVALHQDNIFFKSPNGWQWVDSLDNIHPLRMNYSIPFRSTLDVPDKFEILPEMDVRELAGANIFIGFGPDINTILANNAYSLIHTIPASIPVIQLLSECDKDSFGFEDQPCKPITLPYSAYSISTISIIGSSQVKIARFKIKSCGDDTVVSDVNILGGNSVGAAINGLREGDVIRNGEEREFTLTSGLTRGTTQTIEYKMRIADKPFNYKIQLKTN